VARRISWLRPGLLSLAVALFASSCTGSNVSLIAVQVSPLCVTLSPGGTQQFNANIFVDDVDQGVDNAAVTWSVLGGDVNGVVSSAGLYTAPDTAPPPAAQVVVIATSNEDVQKQGRATVVLTGSCPDVPPPTQAF